MNQDRGTDDDRPGSGEAPDRPASPTSFVNVSSYAGLGVQFLLSILLFLYAGRWIDRKLGTEPWFLIIGVFTGATAGFYAMYRKLTADQKREDASAKRAHRD
jgi:F0F1-type ATP synthase assembly protein I